jgi:nicotinamidase-related amidase
MTMADTAVLVIDVQTGLFFGPPDAYRGDETVQKINELLERARGSNLPIVFVQHDGPADSPLAPFSPGWQLHPGLHRKEGDTVVRKTASDAFHETPLLAALEGLQIRHLLVAGYATDFCVDTTVRRAATLGFHTTLVADAHTAKDRPFLTAQQVIDHHNWVLQNLDSPTHPVQVRKLAELTWPAAG